jgi:hypothetical protein
MDLSDEEIGFRPTTFILPCFFPCSKGLDPQILAPPSLWPMGEASVKQVEHTGCTMILLIACSSAVASCMHTPIHIIQPDLSSSFLSLWLILLKILPGSGTSLAWLTTPSVGCSRLSPRLPGTPTDWPLPTPPLGPHTPLGPPTSRPLA